jgi:hypothetical protein
MEQTVAFINDAFVAQGDVETVRAVKNNSYRTTHNYRVSTESPCVLDIQDKERFPRFNGAGEATEESLVRVRLDRADPRRIRLDQSTNMLPVIWYLTGTQPVSGDDEDRRFVGDGFGLGTFYTRDAAERVAKAYIHAMVLCHKPEGPSLF